MQFLCFYGRKNSLSKKTVNKLSNSNSCLNKKEYCKRLINIRQPRSSFGKLTLGVVFGGFVLFSMLFAAKPSSSSCMQINNLNALQNAAIYILDSRSALSLNNDSTIKTIRNEMKKELTSIRNAYNSASKSLEQTFETLQQNKHLQKLAGQKFHEQLGQSNDKGLLETSRKAKEISKKVLKDESNFFTSCKVALLKKNCL